MEMKISDLLDRWTILMMKARMDPIAEQEIQAYNQEVSKILSTAHIKIASTFDLVNQIARLMEANAKIWVKESALRAGKDMGGRDVGMDLPTIGSTALEIREFNKLRLGAKHAIDKMFGQLPDMKIDHASQ